MTPHTQTVIACPIRNDGHDANGTPGDCFRTAIACLLDLPVLDVPHFAELGEDAWWDATLAFAQSRGAKLLYCPLVEDALAPEEWAAIAGQAVERMNGLVILGGPSPRGPFGHVVVGRTDLSVVHDPHPSRAGLEQVVEAFVWLPTAA